MLTIIYVLSVIGMFYLVVTKGHWTQCLNEAIAETNVERIAKGKPSINQWQTNTIVGLAVILTAAIALTPVVNTLLLFIRFFLVKKK